jgi:hypothetical protein
MGLDISHDAYHMSYSTFSNWRNALATAAGYELVKFNNGGFEHEIADAVLYNDFTSANYEGTWSRSEKPEDPLMYLLVHSDCDGYLEPDDVEFLIPRLEQLIDKLPKDMDYAHWRQITTQFIDGAQRAVDAHERLEFY